MSTKLLKTCEHSFTFKPCSSAMAFKKAPLVMAFAAAFIDFMGAILLDWTRSAESEYKKCRNVLA